MSHGVNIKKYFLVIFGIGLTLKSNFFREITCEGSTLVRTLIEGSSETNTLF